MEVTLAATPKALAFPSPIPLAPPPPDLRSTRRETVRVPRRSVAGGLEQLAAWVEAAPMPELPEQVWSFLGRAWFFLAGIVMGVLFAAALIAITGGGAAHGRQRARATLVTSEVGARALVVVRPATVTERVQPVLDEIGAGAAATTPEKPSTPRAAPSPARTRRVARRPPSHRASADLLSAGL